MNPCPCGFAGTSDRPCACPTQVPERYQRRVSGPLRDRIDLWIAMPRVAPMALVAGRTRRVRPSSPPGSRPRVASRRTGRAARSTAASRADAARGLPPGVPARTAGRGPRRARTSQRPRHGTAAAGRTDDRRSRGRHGRRARPPRRSRLVSGRRTCGSRPSRRADVLGVGVDGPIGAASHRPRTRGHRRRDRLAPSTPGIEERDAWAVLAGVEGSGRSASALLRALRQRRSRSCARRPRRAARPGSSRRRPADARGRTRDPAAVDPSSRPRSPEPRPSGPTGPSTASASSGCDVVTVEDPAYPGAPGRSSMPPHLLYVLGDPAAMAPRPRIAIVGTRRPTTAGRAIGGPDRGEPGRGRGDASFPASRSASMARRTRPRSDAGGTTVAVIGSRPRGPAPARARRAWPTAIVAAGGAVVSELAPDIGPSRGTFPRRNRVISGLADATVVVEAPARSGALITASWALEQGRDCFLVPGRDRCAGVGGLPGLPARVPRAGPGSWRGSRSSSPTSASRTASAEPGVSARRGGHAWPGSASRAGRLGREIVIGRATVDELVAVTGWPVATVLAALDDARAARPRGRRPRALPACRRWPADPATRQRDARARRRRLDQPRRPSVCPERPPMLTFARSPAPRATEATPLEGPQTASRSVYCVKAAHALLAVPIIVAASFGGPAATLVRCPGRRGDRPGPACGFGVFGPGRPSPRRSRPVPIVPLAAVGFTAAVETGHGSDRAGDDPFQAPMDPASVAAAVDRRARHAGRPRLGRAGTRADDRPGDALGAGTFHTVTVQAGALASDGPAAVRPARAVFLTRGARPRHRRRDRDRRDRVRRRRVRHHFAGRSMRRPSRPRSGSTRRPRASSTGSCRPSARTRVHLPAAAAARSRTSLPADRRGVRDPDGVLGPVALAVRRTRRRSPRGRPLPAARPTRPASPATSDLSVRFTRRWIVGSTARAFKVTAAGRPSTGSPLGRDATPSSCSPPKRRCRPAAKVVDDRGHGRDRHRR